MKLREQLEYAAKAMGYVECGWMGDGFTHVVNNQFVFWQPLTDQADSDRMGAKLRINLRFGDSFVWCRSRDVECCAPLHNNTDEDVCRAVREARMAVAVEIGRMK